MPSKMAGNKDSSSPSPDAGSTTRLQRNLAEKQRRDKLNGYISELATIVPMVSMASKRLDKTSILRLSAAHLRISQSFLSGSQKKMKSKWRPNFFNCEQIREILESVEGFLLVTTTNGKIMYVSHSVEKFLGHQNIELMGHSIFSFVHPSDSDMVRSQLQSLCLAVGHKNGSSSTRCSFYCRLRERNQPRSEVLTYQFVHVVGHMTAAPAEGASEEDEATSNASSHQILKAFIRVVHSNPYNELSLADAVEDEYVTRHGPDGTIVFADHRLSTITGHLPHEVYGMSAYEYIISDDIPIALFAHKLMFSNNSGTGLIVYRLRTRNEGFVFLKSTGYLQFEKSTTQVDHFVCVNKLLSPEEGEVELKKFMERFTPHIQETCPSKLYESIKSIKGSLSPSEATKSNNDSSSCPMETDSGAKTKPSHNLDNHSLFKGSKGRGISSSAAPVTFENIRTICSKRLSEKISLETDLSGRMLSNCSPLTESSFSINSPRSEEEETEPLQPLREQPHRGPSPSLDNNNTTSSQEGAAAGDGMPLLSPSSELCDELPLGLGELFPGEGGLLGQERPEERVEGALPAELWADSPMADVLGYASECSVQTPPHSSEEESGKNDRVDSLC